MLRNLFVSFAFIILFFFASASLAQSPDNSERVTDYNTHLIVNKDASIDITENITVYSNQLKIRHGLVRWLPTSYVDSYGITHRSNYQLKEVLMNGKPYVHRTEMSDKNFAVYMGSTDVTLTPGLYTYTLSYHVDNAINFLRDADEIYWNITGTRWAFPIMHASALIQLPEGAKILQYAGYTGATGAKGKDFSVTQPAANQILFTTTAVLPPEHGLTIAVAWPKGFVIQPTMLTLLKAQFKFDYTNLTLLGLLLSLLAYYYAVWSKYGKDPRQGTIIPLFEPPQDLTPAVVRYINKMGADSIKILTATFVSLATKGILSISNENNIFTLHDKKQPLDKLPAHEKAVAEVLFIGGDTLPLKQNNERIISTAYTYLVAALYKDYKNKFFVTNRRFLFFGFLLSLIALLITYFMNVQSNSFFLIFFLMLATFIFTNVAITSLKEFTSQSTFKNFLNLAVLAVCAGGCALAAGFSLFSIFVPLLSIILLFLILITNIVFYHLLEARTILGRKMMDEIEGFKMFVKTTERYRLDELNPPNQTPENFEKLLPYAIALDIENEWAEHFNTLLTIADQKPSAYQPSWYSGPSTSNVTSLAAFPAALSAGLFAATALASTSASSSASGGGGSSGGGGGGGGGGGW